ncbi:hypothetical protein CcaverHIS002_0603220 [Cutaneotrichosporon cavernicola]|nr:hypothetical protein CcaverHIS002_0603220 [Cutaneotrichosporon cavernicola]BEJ01586.1 hypothetical protein CcaverHIS631_0602680 [Cutaneotrichosporon cavernicola]BEJ09353.1 hypothetical protein CcaverHIS641_0602680 [Cutaneotrichosporon cavernicola]
MTPRVYILIRPSFYLTQAAAFILLLMTTLSVLAIPEIALLRLEQHGEWAADLGVFGLCFRSNGTSTHCTRASVGYALPFHIEGMPSAALVVNPVAAGLVGLAMVVSSAYFMNIVAAVVAVLALAVNVAFVMVIGAKVKATEGEYTAHIRNAVWFSTAAVPILLVALFVSRLPGPSTDEEASAGSAMSDTTVSSDETPSPSRRPSLK